jgi:hypothetical protein
MQISAIVVKKILTEAIVVSYTLFLLKLSPPVSYIIFCFFHSILLMIQYACAEAVDLLLVLIIILPYSLSSFNLDRLEHIMSYLLP